MGTKVKTQLRSQPGMYWKRHLQHVDSDKEPLRECREAGTVRFRLCRMKQKLLPPISLCEIDKEKRCTSLLSIPCNRSENRYRKLFPDWHAGAQLELLGPLGNGFPLEEAAGRKVFLMGGGIGVPPMLETMKQLDAKKIAVLGYRDELFLNKEFEKMARYTL